MIFFAGHGEYDDTFKEGYWMPYQAQPDDHAMAIPNSLIKTMLGAIDCHHLFVMVDSCLTGTLFNRGAGKVVQRLEKDPSRWGLTSGRNRIEVGEGSVNNNAFSSRILEILKTNVGPLGVAELCRQVVETLPASADQIPIGEPLNVSGHRGGQFVFQAMRNEVLDWKTASTTGTLATFETFLLAHPAGKYAATAKQEVVTMKAAANWQMINNLPEEIPEEITTKISQINQYITTFEKGEAYNDALSMGENLEYKRDFLNAKKSMFKLRIFAQRNTPYQKEAQELVENFGKEEVAAVVPPVIPVKPSPPPVVEEVEDSSEMITEELQEPISTVAPEAENQNPVTNSAAAEPSYGMATPASSTTDTNKNKKWIYASLGVTVLVAAILVLSKIFFSAEILPIALDANPASGTVVIPLQEGDPPYDVIILRNKVVEKELTQPTKGDLDVSEYFQSEGNYEFKVEDAEKRVFTKEVVVKKDEDYPPYILPKVKEGNLKLTIRKGKPPYQLQIGKGDLALTKTYEKNGTKNIDLIDFRENGGKFEVVITDANNNIAKRMITVDPAPKQGIAVMLFKEQRHHFGTITEADAPEIDFVFTNNGTETLWIEKVKPSSSSLSVEVAEEEFLPGETGMITVAFNPKGRLGSQQKTVDVRTNGEPSRIILTISAEVEKEAIPIPEPIEKPVEKAVVAVVPVEQKMGVMTFEKELLDFGSLVEGQIIKKTYQLKNTGNATLELENINSSCDCLKPKVDKRKLSPGSSTKVTVTLSAKTPGELKETITLKANAEPSTIRVNIVGKIEGAPSSGYPFMVDVRDGRKYKTAKLKDGKVWMVENLNYKMSDSYTYSNKEVNGNNYGRLYKWAAAKKACPKGWHLPSYTEWEYMRKKYGGFRKKGRVAYGHLIEGGDSGFKAQLGGYRYSTGSFQDLGSSGMYWSSTKSRNTNLIDFFKFDSKEKTMTLKTGDQNFVYGACRCVKD